MGDSDFGDELAGPEKLGLAPEVLHAEHLGFCGTLLQQASSLFQSRFLGRGCDEALFIEQKLKAFQ